MASCPFSSPTSTATEWSVLGHLFNRIPRQRLLEIVGEIRHAAFAEGEVLVHEGTKPEQVYLLAEGRLGVYARDGSERLTRIGMISEPGSLVGEQNVREERRFASATVIALTDCRVAAIPSRVFKALLAEDSTAVAKLEEEGRRQVFEKLRRLHEEVAELTAQQILPDRLTTRQFEPGALIYRVGEPARSAFFVVSGEVDLVRPGGSEPEKTVGEGLVFGEEEAVSGLLRQQDARAAVEVEVLEIAAEALSGRERSGGTVLKQLSFAHRLPRLGYACSFSGEVEGRRCMVTDYHQTDGRRVRVRYFPNELMVEASAAENAPGVQEVTGPSHRLSLLLTNPGNRLSGLTASQDWPGLPEAMLALLRSTVLESWQIAALRSTGEWLAEAASERVKTGSEVVCACTGATVTQLRLAANQVTTVEALMQKTGAGSVCGGCRSRLPLMLGLEESMLCRLKTAPLCEGVLSAQLLPTTGEPLPEARCGQHVRVEALLDERWVGRPYTLIGFGPDSYELGVKIEDGGLFSNWLHTAPEGCLVRVSRPQGTVCPEPSDPRPLVHVVAGIGVTTAIASARKLAGSRPLSVHYVYRQAAQAPYLEELRAMQQHGHLALQEHCTGADGRPDAEHWRRSIAALAPCEVLVCGPRSFNEEVLQACAGLEGITATAESFLHAQRGEGSTPRPGSWRLPGFKPACPAGDPVTVKAKAPSEVEATQFLTQFHHEMRPANPLSDRIEAVRAEIADTGTWTQTLDELGFAARLAWRNAERCVGRLYWNGLHLRDCRHLTRAAEVAAALFDHLRFAYHGGDLRPAISVFAPGTPERPGPRLWNPQLLRYAGIRLRTGKQIGDPAQNDLTRHIMKLGWEPAGTDFDLLPLVVEFPGEAPQLFELPQDCRHETLIRHPHHAWLADMGLRWHCVPAVSDMVLDAGGVSYRMAPFNGWYLDAEIAARNFTDTNRYNLLPKIAEAMGLDITNDRNLWRDKALLVLSEAVLHSFDRDAVKISDHHAIGHEFLEFCRNEQKAGREPYGKWMWLVPPVSSSTSVLYQEPFRDVALKPAFRYQKPVWHGRSL